MKLAGFGLLLSGWILVLLALVLLPSPAERAAFVVAALAVEAIGLGLALRGHRESAGDNQ
jgi:hypothetical protein